jgi:HlyD family secretion protein
MSFRAYLHNRFSLPAFFGCSCLLAGLVLQGCGSKEKEPAPVVAVQVTPAKRASIQQTISADAVIFPLQQSVITPKITSTISKFFVQRGSHVKQGQLLAGLENADLAGAEEQSKGEYEQAQASFASTTESNLPQQVQKAKLDADAAKAGYEAQKQIYDARKNLYAEGAISGRDVESAHVALIQAQSQNEQAQKQLNDLERIGKSAQLKAADGQLIAAKGKYLSARAQLSYSEIRSPIDGVVTDRPLSQGELATANQPILTIMNTSRLIAKAHIAQSEAAQLKIADPAELHVAGVDEPVQGKVTLISPALDPGSTTIEVWVEAIQPGPALKPGMNVSFDVVAKTVTNTITVPRSGVFKSPQGEDYVMLAGSDGKAHQANVKVGIRNNESVQIVSGLKENDPVITTGGYALPDGTKISIESAPPAGDEDKDSTDKDNSKDAAPADKHGQPLPAKAKE